MAVTGAMALGRDAFDRLVKAGVCPPNTRRLVIDIQADNVVVVYVEHYDSEAFVEVLTENRLGPEIRLVEAK